MVMDKSLVMAGGVALAVGAVHWFAHNQFGDSASFESAGVMMAGGAVVAATFVLLVFVKKVKM